MTTFVTAKGRVRRDGKMQPAPVCEHLTFVTCRACGRTYDQRVRDAREGRP